MPNEPKKYPLNPTGCPDFVRFQVAGESFRSFYNLTGSGQPVRLRVETESAVIARSPDSVGATSQSSYLSTETKNNGITTQ